MKLYHDLTQCSFLYRVNRFIAKCLVNGTEITVHVKNTGRCKERIAIYGQHGMLHAQLIVVAIGIVIPDMHPILHQVADIRIALQKPEQLMNHTLQKDLLGRQKRESLPEVKAHLVAKEALRARARTVTTHNALLLDAAQQIEVLFHRSSFFSCKLPSASNTA